MRNLGKGLGGTRRKAWNGSLSYGESASPTPFLSSCTRMAGLQPGKTVNKSHANTAMRMEETHSGASKENGQGGNLG